MPLFASHGFFHLPILIAGLLVVTPLCAFLYQWAKSSVWGVATLLLLFAISVWFNLKLFRKD
ncbi:hypothetical protein K2D_25840 [Planctomycetes bacterium K2D]|uniref:Uncharacterized protein n=1 Tax=Botrimarina mediterranea TaxID=2528022 RepID=A0A518K9A9_9BACT|nr:hypothetical protein Spa11_25820 [Botrimarina mediterranea]QDV78975.1 hypothetical protein K2D_25840 [Planctomycetes bacterium K2D]